MKEFDKYITISFKYGGCKHNYKIDKKEIEIHEDNNVWFSYFDFGKYHFEVWGGLDEDRQEMDTKHLDCLAPMRKLELQEYLSQDVLAIEHSEYYKQLIGEDEWCEEEI